MNMSKYENKVPYPESKLRATNRAEYDRLRQEYKEEEHRLIQRFRADVEIDFGMVDHPKAGKLWEKAWDHGHASGLSDVYSVYQDLVELVR